MQIEFRYAIMRSVKEFHVAPEMNSPVHLLQTHAWGELKQRFGWSVLCVSSDGQGAAIAGTSHLHIRRLPFGFRFAYTPRGPAVTAVDRDLIRAHLNLLHDAARNAGAFVLRIEPNWLYDPALDQFLRGIGWMPAPPIQPRTTIHVDLTRELGAIFAAMKPKWRYNIRLAERKGVTVRAGGIADARVFYDLLKTTGGRDRFAIHSFDYYRAAIELLGDYARLFIAEYQGETLAAIFVTAVDDEAIYLYGASSNVHRDAMPNHTLHWHAMQWAHERGCARYDLWGIADTAWAEVDEAAQPARNEEKAKDAEAMPHGLYRFKQGFGGKVVRYIGAYDFVYQRTQYELFTRAMRLRRGVL
ncbi:MAG: peptidoglycan bridge formation glycyltransferase FemA/FemB family protein [Chloroflexi bacterium]|nr:peptidoglycan bridge formation glycyltransferase FemA/FemB family protein [Chloroflexota bacterium]